MFGFNFDRKMLIIMLVILAIMTIFSYLGNPNRLLTLLLTLPAVLVAITFHEYAHALAADKIGDDTPRRQGRLTLNPLAHLDPIGSFLLVFAGFGWGKPVETNPRNYNRNMSMDKGQAIVSVAGPAMNFIIALICTFIYGIIVTIRPDFMITSVGNIIVILLIQTIIINIGLGVFNLIPLPPLDGSKIFTHILPYNAKQWMYNNQHYLYFIFILIWITGLAGRIVSPVSNWIFQGMYKLVSWIIGIFI